MWFLLYLAGIGVLAVLALILSVVIEICKTMFKKKKKLAKLVHFERHKCICPDKELQDYENLLTKLFLPYSFEYQPINIFFPCYVLSSKSDEVKVIIEYNYNNVVRQQEIICSVFKRIDIEDVWVDLKYKKVYVPYTEDETIMLHKNCELDLTYNEIFSEQYPYEDEWDKVYGFLPEEEIKNTEEQEYQKFLSETKLFAKQPLEFDRDFNLLLPNAEAEYIAFEILLSGKINIKEIPFRFRISKSLYYWCAFRFSEKDKSKRALQEVLNLLRDDINYCANYDGMIFNSQFSILSTLCDYYCDYTCKFFPDKLTSENMYFCRMFKSWCEDMEKNVDIVGTVSFNDFIRNRKTLVMEQCTEMTNDSKEYKPFVLSDEEIKRLSEDGLYDFVTDIEDEKMSEDDKESMFEHLLMYAQDNFDKEKMKEFLTSLNEVYKSKQAYMENNLLNKEDKNERK